MNEKFSIERHSGWLRWFAVVLPFGLFCLIGWSSEHLIPRGVEWIVFLALGLGLSGVFYGLVDRLILQETEKARANARFNQEAEALSDLQEKLAVVLRINAVLAEASEESALIQSVLELVGGLTGSNAATYIPLDEWGQPLAAITHGDVPKELIEQWKNRLEQTDVKERCRACENLRIDFDKDCPLAGSPFDVSSEIACVRLTYAGRTLGMINFYFSTPNRLDVDVRKLLEIILAEIGLAIASIRFRNQEIMTLRQLQMRRALKSDLTSNLGNYLADIQVSLDADFSCLMISGEDKIPTINIQGKGTSNLLESEQLQKTIQQVRQTRQVYAQVYPPRERQSREYGTLLIAPITLTEGPTIGAILVAAKKDAAFLPRQERLLESAANQIAQMVENEIFLTDLEYKAVVEERTRLAREIHDGLAQTLAFLKMQVIQMQNTLAKGDQTRLQAALKTCHQTLSDAYLDVRQSIDYLRVTPEGGMRYWLEESTAEFQKSTKISTRLSIMANLDSVPQEIQAQLIRVVQEVLNNIRKHAGAKLVVVSIRTWENDLILEIQDDGIGFSPDDIPHVSQHGLRGIKERAELIGADFQIVSKPNSGTTVRLQLPKLFEETPA